jgi:hypothetical protein
MIPPACSGPDSRLIKGHASVSFSGRDDIFHIPVNPAAVSGMCPIKLVPRRMGRDLICQSEVRDATESAESEKKNLGLKNASDFSC